MVIFFSISIFQVSTSQKWNVSHGNKVFWNSGIKLFSHTEPTAKNLNFSSSRTFQNVDGSSWCTRWDTFKNLRALPKILELFQKSYNSSGNRKKNLPTHFLWRRRYFIANFKNIDRFLPAAKGRQGEFMCFKENWDAGRQHQRLCVSFKMQLSPPNAVVVWIIPWRVI